MMIFLLLFLSNTLLAYYLGCFVIVVELKDTINFVLLVNSVLFNELINCLFFMFE